MGHLTAKEDCSTNRTRTHLATSSSLIASLTASQIQIFQSTVTLTQAWLKISSFNSKNVTRKSVRSRETHEPANLMKKSCIGCGKNTSCSTTTCAVSKSKSMMTRPRLSKNPESSTFHSILRSARTLFSKQRLLT